MGTLAILPSAGPLPKGVGPVVTVSTPFGVVFLKIPASGIPAVDTDALPQDLPQAAIDDLCAIALEARRQFAAWAAHHTTVPTLEAGA